MLVEARNGEGGITTARPSTTYTLTDLMVMHTVGDTVKLTLTRDSKTLTLKLIVRPTQA